MEYIKLNTTQICQPKYCQIRQYIFWKVIIHIHQSNEKIISQSTIKKKKKKKVRKQLHSKHEEICLALSPDATTSYEPLYSGFTNRNMIWHHHHSWTSWASLSSYAGEQVRKGKHAWVKHFVFNQNEKCENFSEKRELLTHYSFLRKEWQLF